MAGPSSWRDLLKEIIRDPAEWDRLANEIGVRPITLSRWADGTSAPRLQNMQQLLQALPVQTCEQFKELLQPGFPGLAASEETIVYPGTFSIELVRQVLHACALTPDSLCFWTIIHQALQYALRQLDPERIGMAITVVSCMPPARDGKIHSLREREGQGTSPWEEQLVPPPMLLGAESLSGHVVMTCRAESKENLSKVNLIPAHRADYEASVIACPIMYVNRIAGCLLLSSRQMGYFASLARRQLISDHAELLALAFELDEFYSPDRIDLRIMPPIEVRCTYFASFQPRVIRLMQEERSHLTPAQADLMIWQQIEAELIAYFSSSDSIERRSEIP